MLNTVIVGHGLAGRHIHAPLIRRQPGLKLLGFVVRDPDARRKATELWGVKGYASLDEALADNEVDLVVVATPHDTHADLVTRTLRAGRHCVVDKVMALSEAEAEAMIRERDASGRMLSVFHNRRWDWDFLTVVDTLNKGTLGKPLLVESSVTRQAAPRSWRGQSASAGTILHDWGAHLVDQALRLGFGPCRRLSAWLIPAPWPGVDSGGHGRITLEFDDGLIVQLETSRIDPHPRPRWKILGSEASYVKHGLDPQEDALRRGNLDSADEPASAEARLWSGSQQTDVIPTVRGSWDAYYANIVDHLTNGAPLAVTAEEALEVVRVLDAAGRSIREKAVIEGPWGYGEARIRG